MSNQSSNAPTNSDIVNGFSKMSDNLARKLEKTMEKYSKDNFVEGSRAPYTIPGNLTFNMFLLPPITNQYYIKIEGCNNPAILLQLHLLLKNIEKLLEKRPEFSSNKDLDTIKEVTKKITKSLEDKLKQLVTNKNGWVPIPQTTIQLNQEADKVKSEWPTLLNGVTDDDTRRKKLVTLALLTHLETFMLHYSTIMKNLIAFYKSKKKPTVVDGSR